MDILLLKTFLEVSRQRHFGRAADKLFITQSAVSARIKLLESTLGLTLFNRKRNDIQLTAEGQRLFRHADTIVRGWERARQELALIPEVTALSIGFSFDLWEIVVRSWAEEIWRSEKQVALQLEMHSLSVLSDRVAAGSLDMALLFEPPQILGLEIQKISDIRLLLYSTKAQQSLSMAFDENYILVDWGISFGMRHATLFGERQPPLMRVSTGSMAKELLSSHGGSAYLSEPAAEVSVEQGRLHPVIDAPVINRPVFAIYRTGREDETLLARLLERLSILQR